MRGVLADGQDDLGDAGVGEGTALPGPQHTRLAAVLVQPGREASAGDRWEGDGADLIALAVQADGAGAGSDGDVLKFKAGAFFHPGPGVQQHGDDGRVAGASAAASGS